MTRVLFVDHTGELGGAELFLCDLAAATGDGAAVLLFADGPLRPRLEENGVSVQLFPVQLSRFRRKSGAVNAILQMPATLRAVRHLAKIAGSYEVICSNSQKASIIAMLAGAMSGTPVIVYLHDILSNAHFSAFNRFLFIALSSRWAGRVLVNSTATRDAYIDCGGKADRSIVLYNGFKIPSVVDVVAPNAVPHATPVIGCFSRLVPWKGQDVLLGAMRRMKHEARLLLVGAPLFGEEQFAQLLHQRAVELGINDRVSFLGFRNDVLDLMRNCDVVVHPSTEAEPFGRAIVEAQLAKRAVVASNGGGVTDIINDGETGVLVSPGDEAALAQALDRLLDEPGRRQAMGEAAYVSARSRFSIETTAANFEQIVQEVVR